MGHERVGYLPRSKRWREIVAILQDDLSESTHSHLPFLAAKTLDHVHDRLRNIYDDHGVRAAFGFLIALSSSSHDGDNGADIDTGLNNNPSPIQLAAQLNSWVQANRGQMEYAELAKRAGADTIAAWTKEQLSQIGLFDDPSRNASTVWQAAKSAEGFCEVSRLFFSKFTERYLRYFLEREASSLINNIEARDAFNKRLEGHIDLISRHAFETAKITQSFAAGWYNNHVHGQKPSDVEIRMFLKLSFEKIREELKREALL